MPSFRPTFGLALSLMAAIGLSGTPLSPSDPGDGEPRLRTVEFETTEGTAISVDVSPDGREIVFDLLGDIYTLPIKGGRAKPLITGRSWDIAPRYSPDGARILFVSDRYLGIDGLWTVDREGQHPTMLAIADSDRISSPIWSHDGTEIAAGTGGGYRLTTKPVIFAVGRGSFDTIPKARGQTYTASLSVDRRFLYVGEDNLGSKWGPMVRLDRQTGERLVLTDSAASFHEYNPLVSRTGRWLAYVRYSPDGQTTLRLKRLDGAAEDRLILRLTDGDDPYRALDDEPVRPTFAFTPDDSAIVLSMSGKIWRVPLDGKAPTMIPFRARVVQQIVPAIPPRPQDLGDTVRIKGIRSPAVTPDGKTLIFSAVGKLWVHDLTTGATVRLTDRAEFEIAPRLSPDGSMVAYLAFTDSLLGTPRRWKSSKLMLARIPQSGKLASAPRPLLDSMDWYDTPSWFPTGDRIFTSRPTDSTYAKRAYLAIDTAGSPPTILPIDLGPSAGYCHQQDEHNRVERRITSEGRLFFVDCITGPEPSVPGPRPVDTVIASIKLDGTDRRNHLTVVGGLTVFSLSSDGSRAVIAPARTAPLAYLVRIPKVTEPAETLWVDRSRDPISDLPITSAAWQNDTTAILALGTRLARVTTGGKVEPDYHRVALALPRFRPSGTLAFRGARILTMAGARGSERIIDPGTLVIRDGRIAAVGEEGQVVIPNGATVINATGLTLMPGLIDVHEHAFQASPYLLDPREIDLLSFGVTTAYNPSTDDDERDVERMEIGATMDLPSVRYFFSGRALTPDYSWITDQEAARRALRYRDALGVSVIKEYLQKSRDQRRALVEAAAEQGLGITSHTAGLQRTLTLVADGFTAWDHFYMETPFYRDVTTLIAASGINVTANISTNQMTSNFAGSQAVMFTETALDRPNDTAKTYRFSQRPAEERANSKDIPDGIFGFGVRAPSLPFERIRNGRTARTVARIIAAGGTVSIGAHDPPGIRTHWEMAMIHRGGASAMAVLRAGTIDGARKFGADQSLGSLEVGKLADLLVLYGDPLEDLSNTTNIKYVVANGVVYDDESMTEVWPRFRRLPRMGWQGLEVYQAIPAAAPLERQ